MRKLGNRPGSPLGRSHMCIRPALQAEMDLDKRTREKAEHMGFFCLNKMVRIPKDAKCKKDNTFIKYHTRISMLPKPPPPLQFRAYVPNCLQSGILKNHSLTVQTGFVLLSWKLLYPYHPVSPYKEPEYFLSQPINPWTIFVSIKLYFPDSRSIS